MIMNKFLGFTWAKVLLAILLIGISFLTFVLWEAAHNAGPGEPTAEPLWLKLTNPAFFIPLHTILGDFSIFIFYVIFILYWYLLSCLIIWLWNKRKANS